MPGRADPRGGFFTATPPKSSRRIRRSRRRRTNTACKVLIEFGDEMDTVGIDWHINNHARTPHGFALVPGMWA
jgi:hypothetical protein